VVITGIPARVTARAHAGCHPGARSLDHLRDTVLASPGPYASDDIALLLARTADAAVA
jgi:hypothetical protein